MTTMTQPATELTTSEINLASIDTFSRPDLPALFRKLRQEAPVSWHQHPDSGKNGFWAVVCYDDIVAVSRDTATFSNRHGVQVLFEGDMPHAGEGSMIEMDPPEHTRFRRLVGPTFSSMSVAKLQDQIRSRVIEILDGLEGKDEIDFVRDFATPLPLGVFYDLMGVPAADQRRMLELADRTFFSADPRFGGDQHGIGEAGREIQAYGRWLAEQRIKEPKDDVMSSLAAATIDGQRLTPADLGAFFGLLGAAGADTTRASLSYGLRALSDFPEQKTAWLQDLEGQAAGAVEEIVRWASPTMHMRRTATRDTQIAGQAIAAGDKVAVWYASGNFDESKFDQPYRFDIGRKPNPHMAFGMAGPHFCLGAHLAKLEIRIAYTELLRRYPEIEATGPVDRLRSNFINGPFSLPARLGPRKS
ncbi:cytochrome P450 [Azohydromonas australica]|uniref:cytochrome P450 n=1 Tax=Azohydromonas australica TaxID=364039 RepID=UPI0004143296|nr:cytochrome P450 [Azohydromonas australica]